MRVAFALNHGSHLSESVQRVACDGFDALFDVLFVRGAVLDNVDSDVLTAAVAIDFAAETPDSLECGALVARYHGEVEIGCVIL
jgi:hypothetical protein